VFVHRKIKEADSRKLAGSKSTAGLSDLDPLSLGRDVVLDISSRRHGSIDRSGE
jgi:hypothetical protein